MFLDIPELSGKQLGLLKEIVPRLSRIAIIGVPGLNSSQFAATEAAVRAVGVEAESCPRRRSAAYDDCIFKGAKPSDLPAQVSVKFEFVINLKTGHALGLDVPPTLLKLADEVIE
jgi:hypothetical protein